MRHRSLRSLVLSSLLIVVGCDAEASGTDAGATMDAGGERDSGSAHDSGLALDSGPGTDAGPADDAGSGSDAGTSTDAGPSVDAGPSADAGPAADAGAVMCGAGGGGFFPTFDRSCSAPSDCVAVTHQTDCCGNTLVTGIRADQRAAFDAAEATCRAMYPGCGCPAGPPRADDGSVGSFDGAPTLSCASGTCSTSFPSG